MWCFHNDAVVWIMGCCLMLDCATIHLVVTTDLLQILLEAGFADDGMIGVTQPRRVVSSAPDRAPPCCTVCCAGPGAPVSSSHDPTSHDLMHQCYCGSGCCDSRQACG
jgi:hypothetical protein